MAEGIFYFIINNLNSIFIVVSVLIFIQGLVLLVFPRRIKGRLERLSITALRIYGSIVISLGLVLSYLYLSILRSLFLSLG